MNIMQHKTACAKWNISVEKCLINAIMKAEMKSPEVSFSSVFNKVDSEQKGCVNKQRR